MARHIIVLNPDKEEDQERLFFLEHGWKFKHILGEIDNNIRNKTKYETLSDQEYKQLLKLRDYLWSLLEDFNVSL